MVSVAQWQEPWQPCRYMLRISPEERTRARIRAGITVHTDTLLPRELRK